MPKKKLNLRIVHQSSVVGVGSPNPYRDDSVEQGSSLTDNREPTTENPKIGFGLFTRNLFDNGSKSKHFIWQEEKEQVEVPEQIEEEDLLIQPYLDSLRHWRYPPHLTDLNKLYDWKPKPKRDEKGIALPMDSNLRITGLQSVTVEANRTHYFGEGDLNRYGGYGYGGGYGGYSSGLDLGLTSSYGYEDFGYSSSGFGGGYGSGYGSSYGSYGSSYGSSYGGFGVDTAVAVFHAQVGLTFVKYSNLGYTVAWDNGRISL